MSENPFLIAARVLREKADVYEQHPDYPWLLPGHEVGHLLAYELRATASALESRVQDKQAVSLNALPAGGQEET